MEKFDGGLNFTNLRLIMFLNQAHAGRTDAWFLKIDPVQIVNMRVCVCVRCVCPHPRLSITSGVM